MTAAATIVATRLGRSFGPVQALMDVDLQLAPRLLHAVVGENGAGKSTLFALLAGLLTPSAGTVTLNGLPLVGGAAIQARQHGVALLRQHGSLLPQLSVVDNFALVGTGLGWLDRRQLHTEVITALGPIAVQPAALVGTLSYALRQQIELVRLRWSGREILLLDEPTAILGAAEAAQLFAMLRQLADQGATVVFSSHRIDEVLEHADETHVLRHGRLTLQRPTSELSAADLYAAMFAAPPAPPPPPPTRFAAARVPALELTGLVCAGHTAAIDLTVAAGEAVGIVGAPSQGQEELVATLAGLLPPVAGTILVGGEAAAGRRPHAWGLHCLPHDALGSAGVAVQSVAENFVLHRQSEAPFTAAGWLSSTRQINQYGHQLATVAELPPQAVEIPLAFLSGGNQRRVLLARELADSGKIFVAHNPEAGLDAQAVSRLATQLRAACQQGQGMLVIAEDHSFLAQVATRVLVMEAGQLQQLAGANWREQANARLSGLAVTPR